MFGFCLLFLLVLSHLFYLLRKKDQWKPGLRVGEMPQWEKHLASKGEELRLDPQIPSKAGCDNAGL